MLPSPRCEQVLAAILESAEEAIIGIALDGSIELWSRGAERLYGYTAAEVTGVALTSLLPIYEGSSLQAVLEAARDGKMTDCEYGRAAAQDGFEAERRCKAARDAG